MAATKKPELDPQTITRIVSPIARKYGVEELYLFGSMARDEAREDSDVDFIYRLSATDLHRSHTVRGLRNDLRKALGRDVDLTRKSYVTDAIDSDPLAELQRRAFVRNLGKYPMYRIV